MVNDSIDQRQIRLEEYVNADDSNLNSFCHNVCPKLKFRYNIITGYLQVIHFGTWNDSLKIGMEIAICKFRQISISPMLSHF